MGEGPRREAVVEQLERVLSSVSFRAARRSSDLLRFVVEETLAGRSGRLKDYTLGAEGLGRGDRFDPRTDPIARVEAARLRARLALYYATEGAADPLVITLPKGAYVPGFEPREAAAPAPSRASRSRWVPWAASVSMAALAAGVTGWWLARGRPSAPETRLEVSTPPTTESASLAVSPDGSHLAFVATVEGVSRLWVRSLDSVAPQDLAGTENASLPFWSPDSQSIAFFADARLKRVDIGTGLVRTLSRAIPAGGAWSRAGVILHPRSPASGLFRISADGVAEPVAQTTLAPGEIGHLAPCFLPDDRHFLFFATGSPSVRGVYLGDLVGTTRRLITDADAAAVFAPPDHLLYVRQGTLFAQALDMRRFDPVGEPIPVALGVDANRDFPIAAISASASGLLAYRTGARGPERQFVWFDRSGRPLARIGSAESRGAAYASASPDFRRVAFQRVVDGNVDIWLLDLARNASIRVTSEPEPEIAPIFSPTGDRIVFSAVRGGTFDLYRKELGAGSVELVWRSDQPKQATDWSRDGRFVLVRSLDPELDWDVWAVPSGGGEPIPLVQTKFEDREAQFAPDGRWIAYQSNESGRFEVYARPFQRAGERVRISTSGDGAVEPRWRSDGRELFYISLDGQLTAVPLTPSREDGGLHPGSPVPLFPAPVGPLQDMSLHHYIVSPDGKRFLMDTIVAAPAPPIVVIQNWKPGTPSTTPSGP